MHDALLVLWSCRVSCCCGYTLFLRLLGRSLDVPNAGLRSWRRAGQPGPLTRLLSCAPESLQGYHASDAVRTVVVPSFRYNIAIEDNYGPYNRPGALLHWLQARTVVTARLP